MSEFAKHRNQNRSPLSRDPPAARSTLPAGFPARISNVTFGGTIKKEEEKQGYSFLNMNMDLSQGTTNNYIG